MAGAFESEAVSEAMNIVLKINPQRIGDWFVTFEGMKFYRLDPRPEDICIEDIAHALSHVCRFGGHSRKFYSVAQHSVLVSDLCHVATFQGLMHDATEAYCGDMVRPLKYSLPHYRVIEQRIWEAICERFQIPKTMHPEVKRADNTVLMTERRDICTPSNHRWSLQDEFPPMEAVIEPWSPIEAKLMFMERFEFLRQRR